MTRDQERHLGGCQSGVDAPGACPWVSPWAVLDAPRGSTGATDVCAVPTCVWAPEAGQGAVPGPERHLGQVAFPHGHHKTGSGDIRGHRRRLEREASVPRGLPRTQATGACGATRPASTSGLPVLTLCSSSASTSAMSLLYECVNTVIAGEGPALPHRDPRGPQPAVGHMRPGPLPASGLQCRVLPPSATHLPCQQDSPS